MASQEASPLDPEMREMIQAFVVESLDALQDNEPKIERLSDAENIEVVNNNSIVVRTDINDHRYQIYTGYHGQQMARIDPAAAPLSGADRWATRTRTAADNAAAAESVMVSGSANCPCCPATA